LLGKKGYVVVVVVVVVVDALTLQSYVICSKTYLHRANLGKQRAQELDGQHSDGDA
jgi:hypothetical protein